jgi:hypothetical protein
MTKKNIANNHDQKVYEVLTAKLVVTTSAML